MDSALSRQINKLPKSPGIYKYLDKDLNLVYVGKSISLKKRVQSYFSTKNLGLKTQQLVKKIYRIEYIKVQGEFEALLLESDLIREHKPYYNVQSKDDKSPIYIKITSGETPHVELTRKASLTSTDSCFIKGPFPSARTTRDILRSIRKIFPYCHHKKPKKPCLFVHLGLCPYPYTGKESKEKYKKTIQNIKNLLNGKSKKLIRDLKKEMQLLSAQERYEEASLVKSQLNELKYITTTYHTPREYLERPTLVDDLTQKRLVDLKVKLSLSKLPRRIECYDISNLSGKWATGSMVVFLNGISEKSEYRRFRIRFKNTPDDFEMIREVLTRRFKNNWPQPNLIIIDGGKGQLSSALGILNKYQNKIPIISLAKKLEEIYVPTQPKPLSLPKESPARQLIQSTRDEAHRFAIDYHRLLRSRDFLK